MKVFSIESSENWICDRFVKEWYQYNNEYSTTNILEADAIWLIHSWLWNHIPVDILSKKKVVTTIHHIDQEKVNYEFMQNFSERDRITDHYHVPCEKTRQSIQRMTKKPIFVHPFWANQNIWYDISDKHSLRKDLQIETDKRLIGSFQRDTEGFDLKTPKLSKGPDIFCDIVENLKDVEIVLAGWRRQYVINRLDKAGIKYHYFEWASFEMLNKLYNSLDLYIISSRCEGGPQAVVECALTETPLISTNVGLVDLILDKESMYDIDKLPDINAKPNTQVAKSNVQKYTIPRGFVPFNEFFNSLRR